MNASGDVVAKNQEVVVLNNCQGGIGIKIVGGKTSSGPGYGIFLKKIISGSPAEGEGRLQGGDKILKVNKDSMVGVSNERAMAILLNASKVGVVTFVVERNDTSSQEYADLMGTLNNGVVSTKYDNFARNLQHSERASPTTIEKRSWILAGGRMSPLSPGRTSKSVIRSEKKTNPTGTTSNYSNYGDWVTNNERPPSPAESNGDSGLHSSSSTLNNMSHLMVARIALTNGLGMSITGGSNHPDGPTITVKELINGGDVYCDGQIKQGDQVVSVNGESFLNRTHEEAKMMLTQIKLRAEKEFEITYIRQRQLGLEKVEKDFVEENGQIDQPSTSGRLHAVKGSLQLDNTESFHKGVVFPSSNQQGFDENCNYTPKQVHPKFSSTAEQFSSIMQSSIQPSSIPFYLQQDLTVSPELPATKVSSSASQNLKIESNAGRVKKSSKRRLSLAPSSKLRVEKLEVALSYLGIQLTPKQQEEIRDKLHADANGLVSYGEFVNVAQEVLHVELQDRSQNINQGKLQFALHDIEKNGLVLDYPLPKANDTAVEELKRQRDDALSEARNLRKILDEKDDTQFVEAEKLENIKRTAEEALEESMALKDQVYLATQAKIAADRKDEEYEEVIRLLEDELRFVKTKGTPKQQEFQDLQKKVIVLGCQLRKIEVVKRTYEVATEKLLRFAERVHEYLKRGELSPTTFHGSNSSLDQKFHIGAGSQDVQQAPLYLSQRHSPQKLADEARDLVRGVRVLLEEEPLPFGWEEAYTSEGERYFINHVTQITSWLHPVTHTKKEISNDI